MFMGADELKAFAGIVAGRVPFVPLLEERRALASLEEWVGALVSMKCLWALMILHLFTGLPPCLSRCCRPAVDIAWLPSHGSELALLAGGIAQVDEGLLPGQDVLAEHRGLGSEAVILSRTFNRPTSQRMAVLF
jgi:hypothetical protein